MENINILEGNWIKERISNPELYDVFRTKRQRKHLIILGCPKGKWVKTTGKGRGICAGGMKLQSIRHPKEEYERFCKQGRCPIIRSVMYGKRWSKEVIEDDDETQY